MKKQVVTVDLGNTNPHFCQFEDSQIKFVKPLNEIRENILDDSPVIISSVRNTLDPLLEGLNVIELPSIERMMFLDMPVNYSRSLGQDRLAQAYYLYKTSSEQRVCLIDSGTFITIDYISKEEGFEGGFILPGIKTFLQSYQEGAKLPILSKDQVNWDTKIQTPHNTYEAISEATKLYISSLFSSIKAPHIVLSGGDTATVKPFLTAEHISDGPHLIHQSLFYIFQCLNS